MRGLCAISRSPRRRRRQHGDSSRHTGVEAQRRRQATREPRVEHPAGTDQRLRVVGVGEDGEWCVGEAEHDIVGRQALDRGAACRSSSARAAGPQPGRRRAPRGRRRNRPAREGSSRARRGRGGAPHGPAVGVVPDRRPPRPARARRRRRSRPRRGRRARGRRPPTAGRARSSAVRSPVRRRSGFRAPSAGPPRPRGREAVNASHPHLADLQRDGERRGEGEHGEHRQRTGREPPPQPAVAHDAAHRCTSGEPATRRGARRRRHPS